MANSNKRVWAAFSGDGVPCIGVWTLAGDQGHELRTWISDRKANGYAFEGEHARCLTADEYATELAKHNLPVPVVGLGLTRAPKA